MLGEHLGEGIDVGLAQLPLELAVDELLDLAAGREGGLREPLLHPLSDEGERRKGVADSGDRHVLPRGIELVHVAIRERFAVEDVWNELNQRLIQNATQINLVRNFRPQQSQAARLQAPSLLLLPQKARPVLVVQPHSNWREFK